MDPQALNNLDPKLRETYERVMGTPTETAPPAVFSPETPLPTTPAETLVPAVESPAQSNTNGGVTGVFQTPFTNTPTAAMQIPQPHDASPLLRVFYIVGALVFFVVYTIFWMKIFNISLPF